MSIVVIIQARMASTRLPGKVLANIGGEPMIWHVVSRTRRARLVDRVVVATSVAPADDALVAYCERAGVDCFRGSESDVLDRFHAAALAYRADAVARVTADCPFIDPDVVDQVVAAYRQGDVDYVSNWITPTFPDGLDVEVFSAEGLRTVWQESGLPSEREHVTPFFYKHPERFRLRNVSNDEDLSSLRWTVDEPTDLEFVRAVYDRLGGHDFGWRDVLDLVGRHPELREINAGFARNEGYERSIQADAVTQ